MPIKRSFIPLFLIIFIDSMGYGLVIPVLLRILQDPHGAFALATLPESTRNLIFGLGIALSPLATLLCAPIIGSLSDRWGRRGSLLMCLAGSVIGFCLPVLGVYSGSVVLLLVGRFLAGAATCSRPIAQAAVTDISTGREKAFLLSMIALAMTLAMVAGPLLGGYLSDSSLVSWFNESTPFVAAALLALLNMILLLTYFKETKASTTRPSFLTGREIRAAITTVFTQPRIRILLFIFFLYEFSWSLYFQDISLFLVQGFHYSVDSTALFIAYAGLWMSLGLTVIYRILIRYLSLTQCLLVCMAINLIGLAGCALSDSAVMQWIGIVPIAIAVGMTYPTLLAMMSNASDDKQQGWVMGVASSALSLSWMLSGVLSGVLSNLSVELPLQSAFVAMVLAAVVYLGWGRRQKLSFYR